MDGAAELGRQLALRHAQTADADPDASILNYAESIRDGGWSLRSALVRVAQAEPARVARVLESVRRVDSALGGLARALERHTTVTDRGLSSASIAPDGSDWTLAPPGDPQPDVRVVDLARLLAAGPEAFGSVLRSYEEAATESLADEEQLALPLLGVALDLDGLAEVLCAWAVTARAPVPVDAIDDVAGRTAAALDAMGIPRETGPPPRR